MKGVSLFDVLCGAEELQLMARDVGRISWKVLC